VGVDCKRRHLPEIFTSGDFFGRDGFRDGFSGFLNGLGVPVWQTELSHDGVHFGIVVSNLAQYIDDFSYGILGTLRPFHNTYQGLLPRFSSFEFVLGDEDVVGQPFAVGNEKSVGSFHLQHPYKGGRGMFQDSDHFSFRFTVGLFRRVQHPDPVAVHGLPGVAFGNEDGITPIIGHQVVLTIAAAFDHALHIKTPFIELELAFANFDEVVLYGQFSQTFSHQYF